ADGPFRVGPNMMVVVPTDTHIEMSYGRSAIDYLTVLLTLVGIGLCVFWRRRGDVVHVGEMPGGFGAGPVTSPLEPALVRADSVSPPGGSTESWTFRDDARPGDVADDLGRAPEDGPRHDTASTVQERSTVREEGQRPEQASD
ncbi:MAG: hypothetical protein WKF60_06620, partial [Ilumatobacter sp.]